MDRAAEALAHLADERARRNTRQAHGRVTQGIVVRARKPLVIRVGEFELDADDDLILSHGAKREKPKKGDSVIVSRTMDGSWIVHTFGSKGGNDASDGPVPIDDVLEAVEAEAAEAAATSAEAAAAAADLAVELAAMQAALDQEFSILAANQSGVPTTAPATPTNPAAVDGCLVVVPPSPIPVWLRWHVVWGITTAGAGRLSSQAYDLTGGGATLMAGPYTLTTTASPAAGFFGGIHDFEVEVGPTTSPRVFGLYVGLTRDGGSSLDAYVFNDVGNAARSHLIAEARP